MQLSLGKTAAANCRAVHREETLQSQKSRSRNSQAKQEKDNIKQWNWILRDGQVTQRIVLHHFCLPDAPLDLDSRNKRGRLNILALSNWSSQHQRLPPDLPGWNSLSISLDPWTLHTGDFHWPPEGKEYQFNCSHQPVSGMLLFRHSKGHILRYQEKWFNSSSAKMSTKWGFGAISLPTRKQSSN